MLKLKRPLVFFDLETTGTNISKDRIVEICIVKLFPNQKKTVSTFLINPQIEIPKEVIEIHGITNEKVKNAPSFNEIGKEIKSLIENCDLAGFNSNKFDVPLLAEEFLRSGINFDFSKTKFVDVQNIYHKMEKRNLSAAYEFYCDKKLENAHSAEADTLATYEILLRQVEMYDDLKSDIDFLSKFSNRNQNNVDLAGFLRKNSVNEGYYSYGKYKNKTLEEIYNLNPGYFSWILRSEFPLFTKDIITDFLNEKKLKKKFES